MAKVVDSNRVSPEEIEAKVEEVARKMEILRVRYEQYFIGIEKVPPATLRMEVARLIRELEQLKIKNTAIKFKMRTQVQKFTSYSTYWNRTLREIEDGTYRRQKDKMRRQAATAAEIEAKSGKKAESAPTSPENQAKVQAVADEAEDFLAALGLGSPKAAPAAPIPGKTPNAAEIAAHRQSDMAAASNTARKPAIVGASNPAIVVAKPASNPTIVVAKPASNPAIVAAKPASNPAIVAAKPASNPAIVVAKPAAKPAIVQPAAKPAIVQPAAKPAIVQPASNPAIVAAKPAIVQPAAKPAIVQPAAKPAIVQPAAKPAIVQPAAKPAIVQPASKPAEPSPAGVARKPAIVGASKPAIVIARPASAQPASKPAIVQPAANPVAPTNNATGVSPIPKLPTLKKS